MSTSGEQAAEARLRAGAVTASPEETRAIAAAFAAGLAGQAELVIALHGDLGAGKTTFVQGLARGFGVREPVTSPTFTVFNLHRGSGRLLAHVDAYRLASAGELEGLMLEDFLAPPWCVALEWPEHVEGWLPAAALHLDLALSPDGTHSLRLR